MIDKLSKQFVKENRDVIEFAGKISIYAKELEKSYTDPSTAPRALALILLSTVNYMLPQMFEDETKERVKQLHKNLDFFLTSLTTKEIQ